MLFATVAGKLAGETFVFDTDQPREVDVEIESVSEQPVSLIQILVNGQVADTLKPQLARTPEGAWQFKTNRRVTIRESSWLAVRGIEPQPDGRKRFAHTAPWFVSLAGQPIAPRREQVEYFISLMEAELTRNRDVLPAAALAE